MKNMGKWVLAAAVVAFCASAQSVAQQEDQEISMSKCTRESSEEMQGCQSGSCSSCGESSDKSESCNNKKAPRKSAAQCAVEGE